MNLDTLRMIIGENFVKSVFFFKKLAIEMLWVVLRIKI